MPKTLKELIDCAAEMVEADKDLRSMDEMVDAAVHLEWNVPENISKIEGFQKYVNTAPYDVVDAATRTFASVVPKPQIDPITVIKGLPKEVRDIDSDSARKKANEWERCLQWSLQQADRRTTTLFQDMIASAFKYDRINQQLIYLPQQIASVEAAGGNKKRYEAMRRRGDFAIKVHHPKDVHTRHSVYGLECVVLTTVCSPDEIVDVYGEAASKLKAKMMEDDCEDEWILVDYTDYETHAVYCFPGESADRLNEMDGDEKAVNDQTVIVLVPPEEPQASNLNGWVCVRGATALDKEPKHQHHSILYSMLRSGQWETVNIAGTIRHTDAIITAGKPRAITEGPDPNNGVDYDYSELGGEVQVKPGHKYTPIRRDGANPELESLFASDVAELNNTAPRTLVTSDTQPGETYSGYDLRVKMAVASFLKFKKQAESALNETYTQMLLAIHYSGRDLNAYGMNDKGEYEQYTIKASEINPECIYLTTTLVTDQPVDRIQQINAATQMAQFLKVPTRYILEWLGMPDPEGAREDYYREQAFDTAWQAKLQLMAAQVNGTLQQMAQQMAQQMVDQMSQQMGAGGAGGGQGTPPNAPTGGEGLPPELAGLMGNPQNPAGGVGVPGANGQGFNPAQGGVPAASLNPGGATYEGATGQTRGGNGRVRA